MFSTEQMDYLTKHFDDRYKKMFVQIDDCNDKQEKINSKFANDDKRIDLMAYDIKQMRVETKNGLKFNNWLTAAVLGAIVAAVIGFYFLT